MAPRVERHAVDVLHHEVGSALLRRAGVEDVRDVRMLEARERELFCLESTQRMRCERAHAQDLHGDEARDRLELLALPDDAERAFTDQLVQADTADARRLGLEALVHVPEEKVRREVRLAWIHGALLRPHCGDATRGMYPQGKCFQMRLGSRVEKVSDLPA